MSICYPFKFLITYCTLHIVISVVCNYLRNETYNYASNNKISPFFTFEAFTTVPSDLTNG